MLTKINSNRFLACLLLCSFIILANFNYGIFCSHSFIPSNATEYDRSSFNAAGNPSAMSDRVFAGRDFMEAAIDYAEPCFSKAEQSRGFSFKTNSSFFSVIPASYAACLLFFRLSCEIYTQFNSHQVASFLHKKDGMK